MTRLRPLAQVVGATIVLIVLLLAPSAAEAHAGHPHHAAASKSVGDSRNVTVDAQRAPDAGTILVAALENAGGGADGVAPRGCNGAVCCGSVCSACSSVLNSVPSIDPPTGAAFLLPLLNAKFGSGIDLESLQRPPRSLV
jgi:hypothetical protein